MASSLNTTPEPPKRHWKYYLQHGTDIFLVSHSSGLMLKLSLTLYNRLKIHFISSAMMYCAQIHRCSEIHLLQVSQEKQAAVRWTGLLTKTRLFSNNSAQKVNLIICFPGDIPDCMLQFLFWLMWNMAKLDCTVQGQISTT